MYGAPPPQWEDLTAEDVTVLRDEAGRLGKKDFTVTVGGRPRRDDLQAEADYVTSLDLAGADWWSEYVSPTTSIGDARALIAGGPVRSTRNL